jgi:hypothetical protein
MADDSDIFQLQLRNDSGNIVSERGNCPGLPIDSGKSMAGQVNRNHSEVLGEGRDLSFPVCLVTHPPMDQHNSRLTGAVDRSGDFDTVWRFDLDWAAHRSP